MIPQRSKLPSDGIRTRHLAAIALALIGAGTVHANCPVIAGNAAVAPDSRFVNHGNGTITDTVRELMWSRQPVGSPSTYAAATTAASGSVLAGHTDWRLPTRQEFADVIETACTNPALNTTLFDPGPVRTFWTSEAGAGTTAWSFDITQGNDALDHAQAGKGVYIVRSVPNALFANGFE